MRNSVRATLACCVIVVSGFASCTSEPRSVGGPPGELGGPDGGPDAPSSCAGLRCSRDLHSVIDGCSGALVEACPEAQGCAHGACVPACQAAAESQGSVGCSFWTTPQDVFLEAEATCFAAFVANTWSTPATVKARFGAEPLDITRSVYRAIPDGRNLRYERIEGPIPAGEVGIVFLAQGPIGPTHGKSLACPPSVEPAYLGVAVAKHETSIYRAFQLESDLPVSAYSIYPYGGASTYMPYTTLLLPTSSWRTNYIAIDGFDANVEDPVLQIVAQQDDTVVRMRPKSDVQAGPDVAGAPRGGIGSWTLSRGQVLELRQPESLAGSPIESTHPIALFGGTICSYVPYNVSACDSLQQQIPPLEQWGSHYSGVPYMTRRRTPDGKPLPETVMWRIVGARDGTVLTWHPSRPDGAPERLASGEIVHLNSDVPFTVRSQDTLHPFYLAQYMSGGDKYWTLGDPEFVNVIPNEQFLDHYVFFVDHTFANSSLTVVRKKDAKGFHDVTLDCAGTLTGWQPLGEDGSVEYTWVELTTYGTPLTTPAGTCSYGRHETSSDGPFETYVWGIDAYASYGYPAGAGSRPTTPLEIPVH